MRTSSKVLLAILLAFAAVPAIQHAGAAQPVQTVEGSVAAGLRYPLDATYTSWVKPQRDLYNNTGDNGHVGYTFAVNPKAVGGAFTLAVVSGATGQEDLDVTWYSDLSAGTSTGAANDRGPNGETGTIPSGSTFGIVTLFHGAEATFLLKAYAPVAAAAPSRAAAPLPKTPGIYADFGKGDSALARTLRSRSHVVIAVVDTGINPYHLAYRNPEYAVHPSEYIEGFPKDVPALGLTFGKDYIENRNADDASVWSKVSEKKLYWIPGTNIIGGYSVKDYFDTTPGIGDVLPEGIEHSRPIIDDSGHGTGTTSVSGGAGRSQTSKAPFGSNPEALIVSIEGLGTDGVKWASEQPWIDFISGSYGDPAAVPYNDLFPDVGPFQDPVGEVQGREYRHTAPFVLRDGRTACFSAGNGLTRTGLATDRYSSIRPTSGPSWVVTVGAVSPRNNQDYGWHSWPVDISSYGAYWPAAAPFSIDGEQAFSGTSNATPVTCGAFSKALLEARRALGDAVEGIHIASDGTRVPALGPKGLAGGLVADGVLTREELQDAVFKTAMPGALDLVSLTYDPIVIPDSPAAYTQQGYGIANAASGKRAADVILGKADMPSRPEVDSWIALLDGVRNTIWAPPVYEKAAPPAKPKPKTQPKPKPKPAVLGKRLPATGLADNVTLTGLLLIAAALTLRRFTLTRR